MCPVLVCFFASVDFYSRCSTLYSFYDIAPTLVLLLLLSDEDMSIIHTIPVCDCHFTCSPRAGGCHGPRLHDVRAVRRVGTTRKDAGAVLAGGLQEGHVKHTQVEVAPYSLGDVLSQVFCLQAGSLALRMILVQATDLLLIGDCYSHGDENY